MSQITPLSSLHFDHAFVTLLSTSLLAPPPPLSIVDPIYLKDLNVGKLTISVYVYLFILTGVVSPVVCRCSVFALLTLSPFFSIYSLYLPSLNSIIALSGSHITRSSANSIVQGVPSSIASVITSIMTTNNSGLSAEPWWYHTLYPFGLSRTGHDAYLAPSIHVPDYVYVGLWNTVSSQRLTTLFHNFNVWLNSLIPLKLLHSRESAFCLYI